MSILDHQACPYKQGHNLTVQLNESFSPLMTRGMTLHLEIQERFDPVTISPVLLTKIVETGEILVAKFFDRRFSPQYRKYQHYEQWNTDREEAFRRYVLSGEGSKFLDALYGVTNDSLGDEGWTTEQEEVNAHDDLKGHFENEVRTYHALEWLQGQNVAKMLGTISFRILEVDGVHQEYFEVHGVLLEFIHGFNLSDMTAHVPESAWKGLIEEAISIVNAAGDLGVFDRDMSVYHFLVREKECGGSVSYQPIMFDFGHTEHRDDFDTLDEWMITKCGGGEESAIGMVMARRVDKAGGSYDYIPSHRWGVFKGLTAVWQPPPGCFEWRGIVPEVWTDSDESS